MKRNGGKIPRDCGYVNVSALEEGVDLLSIGIMLVAMVGGQN